MANCRWCQADTELYSNGAPICARCADDISRVEIQPRVVHPERMARTIRARTAADQHRQLEAQIASDDIVRTVYREHSSDRMDPFVNASQQGG
jgi:hypothetical protein